MNHHKEMHKHSSGHEEHKNPDEHGGGDHAGHHASMFRNKFFIVLLLSIPILALSPTIHRWLNFSFSFPGEELVLFALASIVVIWGGWPFFAGAKKELAKKRLGMMVLVSVALLAGYFYSVGATFVFTEAPDFYWEISTLTLFLLFGHWMEMRAVMASSGALGELAKLIPKKANLIKGDEVIEISTDELKIGDIILIKPGEKVPIDGVVIEGETSINESMITGESTPIHKKLNDKVIGGSINFNGSIKIKVSKTGKNTTLNQIIKLVEEAQSSKPRTQKMADVAAHYLTISAISIGTLSFLYWAFLSTQDLVFALTMAITVVVIACPHALGLAIPVVTSISTTLAAKNGMLIRDMTSVETAEKLDYVVFDKTGTLTKGVFEVTDIVGDKQTLSYASAIEQNSEHIIGEGIIRKVKSQKLKIPSVSNFRAIPGKGAVGVVGSKEVFVGNLALLEQFNVKNTLQKEAEKFANQGKTIVYVTDKNNVFGVIALSDVIREESKETIRLLKEMNIKTAMITGDNKHTAEYVAKELGIDIYFSDVLPKDKVNKIKELQQKGKVAMVGDGINDAPALTQADVGIAIGAGTDVAVQSAEVVLVKSNPLEVVKLIRLSGETRKKMKQNLWWAAGYNIVAIPIAAGVLMPIGIRLRPEFGALLMAASSLIVVGNSLMLKRFK
ncbi:heavy metal translocating P-type ATPase [Patescibacteria group bacterium]|nr:heavy metal translocating P-type ATPase [Patescibacteria group bacterium]